MANLPGGCVWVDETARDYVCARCRRVLRNGVPGIYAACRAQVSPEGIERSGNVVFVPDGVSLVPAEKRPPGGPGSELHALLGRLGIHPAPGCGCKARLAIMDSKGCGWCRENLDTIVAWLREEAAKRRLPFVETLARLIVRSAIRRAEKKAPSAG